MQHSDNIEITEQELETFIKSKGWHVMANYLQTMYLESEAMVTADGREVSNSVRLEHANKMSIVKKAIHYPTDLLQSMKNQNGRN